MRETILMEAMERIAKGYKLSEKGHTLRMRRDEMINVARKALLKVGTINAQSVLVSNDYRKGN